MLVSLQGGVLLDFFCAMKGENEEGALSKFLELVNVNDLKIKEITLEGSDGNLHKIGVERSEMEIDSVVEVDEDFSKKHKDYQVGSSAVL